MLRTRRAVAPRLPRRLAASGALTTAALTAGAAHAQGSDTSGLPASFNPIDTYSFQLSVLFIAFGLIVIGLQLLAVRRISRITADDVARNCAITLIVVSSVALLVSGYSSAQVAPAFGLFGTIVGYLLGRANSNRRDAPETPAAGKPNPEGPDHA